MCNAQAVGSIRAFSMEKSQQESVSVAHKRIILFIHTGRFRCFDQTLNAGDVLDIESSDCKEIKLECLLNGTLILSEIELV